jgi:Zn-dependent peptidase ImmA (M78 family)
MSELIPINAEVLKWARESAGLSVDDVVCKVNRRTVSHATIIEWETGLSSPTYPQLEKLAYDIYKRPLAVFFFPEPPEEITPEQSFRTLPKYEIEHMPSKIKLLLRKAQAYQFNLYELYDGVNMADRKIMKNLSFDLSTSIIEMGKEVRTYLSVSLEDQASFGNPENAFKEWRKILEELGVFVFKDAFKEDNFSGFCLYDEIFPIIYINNSKSFTRQIFTLFHELAHLLFKTGGIDTHLEDYINYLDGDNEKIEIICNSFAGEFLVPSDSFISKTKNININEDNISLLANTYNVSREVILRKFLDQGRVEQEYYYAQVDLWKKRIISKKPKNGGNYYFTQGAYLGVKYIEKAFSQYYQERITTERLADYLGVKNKNLPGVESLVFKPEAST